MSELSNMHTILQEHREPVLFVLGVLLILLALFRPSPGRKSGNPYRR
jgi:hypothetical protein